MSTKNRLSDFADDLIEARLMIERAPRRVGRALSITLIVVLLATLAFTAVILATVTTAGAKEAPTSSGPRITSVSATSESADTWTKVVIDATWEADAPKAGDSFTVSLSQGLSWPKSLSSFWVITYTDGTNIGDCSWPGGPTITCTLNEAASEYDHLTDGTFHAEAVRTEVWDSSKGTLRVYVGNAEAIVNDKDHDGTCDALCDTIDPKVTETTRKVGWHEKDEDGQHVYHWDVYLSGYTNYIVTDPGAKRVFGPTCTSTSWTDGYEPNWTEESGKYTVTPRSASDACRIRFETRSIDTQVSNTAYVNGVTQEAKAFWKARGNAGADGANDLAPAPSPSPTPSASPSPEPSASPSPSATPSVPATTAPTTTAPTTTAPTPSLPVVSPSPETPSKPSATSPAPEASRTPAPEAPVASEAPAIPELAKTGLNATATILFAAGALLVGIGFYGAVARKKAE